MTLSRITIVVFHGLINMYVHVAQLLMNVQCIDTWLIIIFHIELRSIGIKNPILRSQPQLKIHDVEILKVSDVFSRNLRPLLVSVIVTIVSARYWEHLIFLHLFFQFESCQVFVEPSWHKGRPPFIQTFKLFFAILIHLNEIRLH